MSASHQDLYQIGKTSSSSSHYLPHTVWQTPPFVSIGSTTTEQDRWLQLKDMWIGAKHDRDFRPGTIILLLLLLNDSRECSIIKLNLSGGVVEAFSGQFMCLSINLNKLNSHFYWEIINPSNRHPLIQSINFPGLLRSLYLFLSFRYQSAMETESIIIINCQGGTYDATTAAEQRQETLLLSSYENWPTLDRDHGSRSNLFSITILYHFCYHCRCCCCFCFADPKGEIIVVDSHRACLSLLISTRWSCAADKFDAAAAARKPPPVLNDALIIYILCNDDDGTKEPEAWE